MSQFVLGMPPQILNLVQQGLLERAFHDGLVPAFLYRNEAQYEEWAANTGTEIFMSRPGLLSPVTRAITPGQDPTPQVVAYEQWAARLQRYAATIDTHIPTSIVSNGDQFLRNIQQLGLQAGQSLNRIPRNALFTAYLSGQTVLTAAGVSGNASIQVASLNGFTEVVTPGLNVRPSVVSSSTPLQITIDPAGTPITRNVIGFDADDPDDLNGPGILYLDAALGATPAARTPVLSIARPQVIRSGGGSSVDAIASTDVFTLQDCINAVNRLRKANVPPHPDGTYHAHINTDANGQAFLDPFFRQMLTALPDSEYYQNAFIGKGAGCSFYLNTESPDPTNVGPLTATSTLARYGQDIGAEVVNNTGVSIGRVIITGRGALYEKGLDEKQFITEAGATGKVGDFQIVNAGVQVMTDRVRLILRAPMDRLQDIVAATWSISTAFPVPSDVSSGGPELFKRAICIEHAAA